MVLQESVAQLKTNKRNTNKWGGGIREWDYLRLSARKHLNDEWMGLVFSSTTNTTRRATEQSAKYCYSKACLLLQNAIPRALGSLLLLLDKEWFPKANQVWKQEARRRFNWEKYCLHHHKSTTVSSLFSSPLFFFFKVHDTASDRDLVPAGSNLSSHIPSLQNNADALCICPIICIS